MSKYWGVGEEDDHIPPSVAEFIPPPRYEQKKAKLKLKHYNATLHKWSGGKSQPIQSITKSIGKVRLGRFVIMVKTKSRH
jgi:hypothetical protein